jgi:hypothetical protein
MKTVVDTLGVARSNLVDQVRRPPRRHRPIAKPMMPGCCRWCRFVDERPTYGYRRVGRC